MNLPDFICIGVQRAGTTWLYECLKEHPEVFVPETKELHFFNDNYEKGIEFYSQYFEEADSVNQVIGELTPNYYHDIQALQRISQKLPNVKVILILREPIARAYSHYQLSLTNQCKNMTFDEALAKVPTIKKLSMQSIFLKEIIKIFPNQQLHIELYDNLESQPLQFIKKIYSFLGVNDNFHPSSLETRVNRIIFPQLQEYLAKLGLHRLVEFVKATKLGELIKENYNSSNRKKLRIDLNRHKQDFTLEICELETILNRDLSHWKKN